MKNNLVSIIMPAYNASETIKDSIDSVISQTYTNWELIVVDDCSTDNTLSIIEKHQEKDNRIKVLRNVENLKVAKTRNKGLDQAQGDFIAFLDADDMWFENKLEKQLKFMLKQNVDFSYTNITRINNDGEYKELYFDDSVDYKKLLKSNQVSCLTVMLKSELTKNLRMKDIGHEDYMFWLEILKGNNVVAYNVNEVLAYYRVGNNSLSSNKLRAAKWQWNIYRNELGLSFISSALNFIIYSIKGVLKHL